MNDTAITSIHMCPQGLPTRTGSWPSCYITCAGVTRRVLGARRPMSRWCMPLGEMREGDVFQTKKMSYDWNDCKCSVLTCVALCLTDMLWHHYLHVFRVEVVGPNGIKSLCKWEQIGMYLHIFYVYLAYPIHTPSIIGPVPIGCINPSVASFLERWESRPCNRLQRYPMWSTAPSPWWSFAFMAVPRKKHLWVGPKNWEYLEYPLSLWQF